MSSPVGLRRSKWLGLAVLLAAGLGLSLCLLLRPETLPPCQILHRPVKMPLPPRDRLFRLVPAVASSAWAWSLGNAIFGLRTPVNIYGDIVALSHANREAVVSALPIKQPVFSEPTGLQVWFLPNNDIQAVRQRFKKTPGIDFLEHPRISMADGIQASLFSGQLYPLNGVTNEVGVRVEYFTRVRTGATDLYALVTVSEVVTNQMWVSTGGRSANFVSIQTNLDLAARLQIPKGQGALLISSASKDPKHRDFAFLIDPP